MGGAVVVMRRIETGEVYLGEVPLDLFRGEAFKDKLYLEAAAQHVWRGLEALGVQRDEPIHICAGYILSKARMALKVGGFRVVTKRIKGETQALAEREFIMSLDRMGVGNEAAIRGMRNFSAFLKWVLEDLDGRERYVKTGWRAWPKLRRGRAD